MRIAHFLAHLFVPRESNNQRAKLLHPSSLTLLTLFLIIFQAVLTFSGKVGPQVLGYAANIPPSEVIRLTNEKRIMAGVAALKENATLSQAAQAKGADMLNKGYWAHVAPDGTQPWKFFGDFGYKYRYAGENLARDFSDPTSAVNAWMASPSHKENLLSPRYKEIGVAVVEGNLNGVDTTIIVQFFGTKYSESNAAVIPPVSGLSKITKSTPTPRPSYLTLGELNVIKTPVVSPFSATRYVSLALIGLILIVLAVDGAVIFIKKVPRISGRTIAHLSFLGMILAVVLILKAGEII